MDTPHPINNRVISRVVGAKMFYIAMSDEETMNHFCGFFHTIEFDFWIWWVIINRGSVYEVWIFIYKDFGGKFLDFKF
jgi:hypothetical protein